MFVKLNSEYAHYPVINTDYVQYFKTRRDYNSYGSHYYYYIDILFTSNTELKSFCYGEDDRGWKACNTDFERLTKLCLSTANPPVEKTNGATNYAADLVLEELASV